MATEPRTLRGPSVSKRAFLRAPAQGLADVVQHGDPCAALETRKDGTLHEDRNVIRGDRLGRLVRNIKRAGGTSARTLAEGAAAHE